MQVTLKKSSAVTDHLKRTFADPVLWYTVLIMTTIMYHFYKKGYLMFALASVAATYLLFRLFDYVQKHKLIGGALYIAAGYLAFQIFVFVTHIGYDYYTDVLETKPISYALWFFTPQLALDYNVWYSWATFILFQFFMASVIYYFTRVIYRVFMNFLIMMIPFIIYGKEYEKMFVQFIILIVASYIGLMVYCRQLHEDSRTVVVGKRGILSSAGIFTLTFMIVASVFPKPQIKANREAVESLIAAERFTDRLVASLSGFRGSSSGQQFRGVNNSIPLYYVKADEPLHLKTNTLSSYNFDNDSWKGKDLDSDIAKRIRSYPSVVGNPGDLPQCLMKAAAYDSSFAAKYGLTELVGKEFKMPKTKSVDIYSVYRSGLSVPVPQYAQIMRDSTFDSRLDLSVSGVISQDDYEYARNERFTFDYCEDSFMNDEVNRKLVNAVSSADYMQLLRDVRDVLYDVYEAHENEDTAEKLYADYKTIVSEYKAYKNAVELLNFDNSNKIKELAAEITAGKGTDYAKAQAIEVYFLNNGYVYDLDYVKSRTENVEDFLFRTKRGVCYEYATSMVLLARACGIPARYCEGFMMQTPGKTDNLDANFVITPKDAHAYPELYIKGLGWVVFEPTMSTDMNTGGDREGNEKNSLAAAGLTIFGTAVLALILYLLMPMITHKVFLRMCRKKKPSAVVIAAMQRICRIYRLGRTVTSAETAAAVRLFSGADISELELLFNRAAYGGEELSEQERDKAIEVYTAAFEAYREALHKKKHETA